MGYFIRNRFKLKLIKSIALNFRNRSQGIRNHQGVGDPKIRDSLIQSGKGQKIVTCIGGVKHLRDANLFTSFVKNNGTLMRSAKGSTICKFQINVNKFRIIQQMKLVGDTGSGTRINDKMGAGFKHIQNNVKLFSLVSSTSSQRISTLRGKVNSFRFRSRLVKLGFLRPTPLGGMSNLVAVGADLQFPLVKLRRSLLLLLLQLLLLLLQGVLVFQMVRVKLTNSGFNVRKRESILSSSFKFKFQVQRLSKGRKKDGCFLKVTKSDILRVPNRSESFQGRHVTKGSCSVSEQNNSERSPVNT